MKGCLTVKEKAVFKGAGQQLVGHKQTGAKRKCIKLKRKGFWFF